MSLLNYTVRYLSVCLIVVLSIWAAIFYYNMLDEVYDSLDDGLENYKMLIIGRAHQDAEVLRHNRFNEGNYFISEISREQARQTRDSYRDSTIYTINERDYEPVRVLISAFEVNGQYYLLTIMSSMVEEDDLIEDLFYSIIWLYVSLLVVIILVHQVIVKRLWSPFFQMVERLKRFKLGHDQDIGHMDVRVREFKQLKTSVDMLIKSSNAAYDQQKQFIENAAHELQTPLAIGINKLELLAELLQDGVVLETIGQVNEELLRLKRLNKSLLQLSRIENSQFDQSVKLSFTQILREHLDDFTALAEFNEVELHLVENADCIQYMNEDLAKMLSMNLLKNAIMHNVAGGFVEVIIDEQKVTFMNSGKKQSLNTARLFQRFYKEGTAQGSSGLGLSIVKAIAEHSSFEISYLFEENRHTFTVSFG